MRATQIPPKAASLELAVALHESNPQAGAQVRRASGNPGPRVLVVLNTSAAWCRGILRGFMAAAHEHDWALLHYHPDADMTWLANEWAPDVAVIGPELPADAVERLAPARLVSVNLDRTPQGIPSVCLDEEAISRLALQHLHQTGLRHFSTFRFDGSPFAIARERAFIAAVRDAGAQVTPGWGSDGAMFEKRVEKPADILEWLAQLPKPCGIFTCTDIWGRAVARYVRAAGLSVPEQVALVGVDNDVLECELISPPLSSVMVPWQELGRSAAELVRRALMPGGIEAERLSLSPIAVVPRRSSDVFAVSDPLVAQAVRWIRANAEQRVTVSMVAAAMGGGRKRLERRFRAALDRTVHDEIRRAHVDVAKKLLEATELGMVDVARQSGFTNAALLSTAFQRETGMPPGLFRRRMQHELGRPGRG
jgi:LacI family transcriptional regulator